MPRLQPGGLILGAGILALILIAVPVSQNWFRKPPELANLARLDRLQMACRLFAADHSGRYPTHLEAVSPEYLTAEALEDSRYQVIERQKGISVRLDWLYFGTGFEDTRLPRVLIAAPQFIDNAGQKSRIYLGGDGQSRIAPEEEYQNELAETVRELQEMMKRRSPPSSSPSLQRTQPE